MTSQNDAQRAEPPTREERFSVRNRTREDLFRIIATGSAPTRPELIAMTGMSRSTINNAISQLIADGRVTETTLETKGRGSGSGRPATRLTARASGRPVGGIDFGHTHIHVAVANSLGAILGEKRVQIDVDVHAAEAMDLATSMMNDLVRDHGISDLSGVTAGIPGPLDRDSGLVMSPTILSGWVNLAPSSELERRLGVPVQVENDALLGAYGELTHGAGRNHSDFLYVKASHGIGASVIINRTPYRGASGLAGEIGHTTLSGRTESCRCGSRGCLEAVVSVSEIQQQIIHAHPWMTESDTLFSGDVDAVTSRVLNEAGRTLGVVIARLCDLLNPSAVIVGGELGAAHPAFIDGIRDSVDRDAQPATAARLTILPSELNVRSELLGALAMARSGASR